MALVNITRKPSQLQGYQLATPTDMFTALAYLSTRGYNGSVACYRTNGTPTWTLSLQADNGTNGQSGGITDWVVIENDTIATILTAAKAAALFQVAS